MSRPHHPARIRRGALIAALAALPAAALPTAASADYTSANQWAGGSISPARQPGRSTVAARSTLVSMTTSPTKARIRLSLANAGCSTADTLTGVVVPGAGGDAEQLVLGVQATRKVRDKRQNLTYALVLRSAAPGVLTGTASVRGTFKAGKRTVRCNVSGGVLLRSRSALASPLQPLSTDRALPRVGVVASTVAPRVKAAIAMTRRADGQFHAVWTEHVSCISGSRRSSFDDRNYAPRFRVRADGTFRGREVFHQRGKVKGGRFSYRFVGVIKGRIDADGIARGTVTTSARYKETGYLVKVCRLPTSTFAAAP